jgi:hypothetical protein
MSTLRPFEREAVRLLAGPTLEAPLLDTILALGDWVAEQQASGGYDLSVRCDGLPEERVVCHMPTVIGTADDVLCGFVVFIENGELTLECHSWGGRDLPADIRDHDMAVGTVERP